MITSSDIGEGDRLGAQMSALANLLWLGQRTGHEVVFHSEVRHASQGLQFLDVFDLPIRLLPGNALSALPRTLFSLTRPAMRRFWQQAGKRRGGCIRTTAFAFTRLTYHLLRMLHRRSFSVPSIPWGPRLHCDPSLVSLLAANPDRNFDIRSGRLGSYQDWKEAEENILPLFRFKPAVARPAERRLAECRASFQPTPRTARKELVAVHFRLADYLIVSSLNLPESYYREALSLFPPERYAFLIFSDDIQRCRDMPLFSGLDVFYADGCSAGEGMCLMSLCDHAVIANSTYSFWGAMLNRNPSKRIVCPHDFAGQGFPANGLWYPSGWTALPVLCPPT